MAIVDELVTLLTLDGNPSNEREAGKLSKSLDTIKAGAVVAGAALLAAAGAVTAWVSSVAETVDQQAKLAESVGLTYEQFQELAFITEKSGGELEGLRGDLDGLITTLGTGEEFGKEFEAFGIKVKDARGEMIPTADLLDEIAGVMDGMSRAQSFSVGKKLGLGPDLILAMQNGTKGLQELRAEARSLGAILPEDSKTSAKEYRDAIFDIKAAIFGLTSAVAVDLMPAMTDVLETFKDWVVANREVIALNLKEVVTGIGRGFEMFFDILSGIVDVINPLIEGFTGFEGALESADAIAVTITATLLALSAAGIAAGVGMIIATWPFWLAAAAVAAVALVVEDFIVWLEGGESAFGDFYQAFADGWQTFEDGWNSILEWRDRVAKVFSDLANADLIDWPDIIAEIPWDDIIGLDKMKAVFGAAVDWAVGKWTAFTDFLGISTTPTDQRPVTQEDTQRFNSAGQSPASHSRAAPSPFVAPAPVAISPFAKGGNDDIKNLYEMINDPRRSTAAPAPVTQNNTSTTTTDNSVGAVSITINESKDGRSTAREIKKMLKDQGAQQTISPGLNAGVVG